jgi:hypothetical protein
MLLTAKTMLYLIQSIIFKRPHFSDFSGDSIIEMIYTQPQNFIIRIKGTYPFLRIDTII